MGSLKRSSILFCLGFILSTGVTALSVFAAGSEGPGSSGGGDNAPAEVGSAWFMGAAPVRVCYQVASGFGVDDVRIKSAINDVFATWREYIQRNKIYEGSAWLPLTVNYTLLVNCDGSEELKFLFGITSDEVAQAKAQYTKPVAFAHRQSYDLQKGRGRGFIWVAEESDVPQRDYGNGAIAFKWTRAKNIESILLHELGHVFGCEHVSGTIMREDIATTLDGYPYSIDWLRLLTEDSAFSQEFTVSSIDPTIFKRFTGQDAKKLTRVKVKITPYNFYTEVPFHALLVLSTSDQLDGKWLSFEVPFVSNQEQAVMDVTYTMKSPQVFKVAVGNYSDSMYLHGEMIFGLVKDFSGKEILTRLEINITSSQGDPTGMHSPVGLFYFENGKKMALFDSTNWGY